MKHQGILVAGLSAVLCSAPLQAFAAQVVAATVVKDIGPLAIGIQAVMILVAGIVVFALGIGAFSNFERGDMSSGVFGIFKCVAAAILLFVIIDGIINGKMAAASTLW